MHPDIKKELINLLSIVAWWICLFAISSTLNRWIDNPRVVLAIEFQIIAFGVLSYYRADKINRP